MLTVSEVFLLVWAMLATIFSGVMYYFSKRMFKELLAFKFALLEVAQNRAKVYMNGDTVKVESV